MLAFASLRHQMDCHIAYLPTEGQLLGTYLGSGARACAGSVMSEPSVSSAARAATRAATETDGCDRQQQGVTGNSRAWQAVAG